MTAGISILSRRDAGGRGRAVLRELLHGVTHDAEQHLVERMDVAEPLEGLGRAVREAGDGRLERVEGRPHLALAVLDHPDHPVRGRAPVVAPITRPSRPVDQPRRLQPSHGAADGAPAGPNGLADLVDGLVRWVTDEQPGPEAPGDRRKTLRRQDPGPALDELALFASHDGDRTPILTFQSMLNCQEPS